MITESILNQFCGTEEYYYTPLFSKYRYTDGIKYIKDNGGDWLIIDILAYSLRLSSYDFLIWELNTNLKDGTAILTATYDNGSKHQVFKRIIKITDFPIKHIKMYLINNILMLASEY